jgi:peptide-methionine (S)-S-oxide reductase
MRLPAGPLLISVVLAAACAVSHATPVAIPAPVDDEPLAATPTTRQAVVAGGCFWGIEAVYEHVRGVVESVSGYAGGSAATARYDVVSAGTTGHAESVRVTYDASRLTYGQILHVFFSVAHDPTQLNRQGPDHGPQYRSAIFAGTAAQERIARAYISQLTAARAFRRPIVTEIASPSAFYPAEPEHQDYAARNPGDLYIRINDAPKVTALEKQFPSLFIRR